MKLLDCFEGFELTQGQTALVERLQEFLSGDESVFLLKGYAGVGKTFITSGITKYLSSLNIENYMMAPTGKAAKVISKKTKKEAYTIHRVIYKYFDDYRRNNSNNLRPKTFSTITCNDSSPTAVFIIDEASLISNTYNASDDCYFGSGYLLDDLFEYLALEEGKRKVILIGDNAQLPPVKSAFSPALNREYIEERYDHPCKEFELTEVVRQKAGSGVVKNATEIRETMLKGNFNEFNLDDSANDVCSVSVRELITHYLSACENNVEKTDGSIIITHSNRDAMHYNESIRAKLFHPDAGVQVGDKIICIKNLYLSEGDISNGDFGRISKIFCGLETRTVNIKIEGAKLIQLHFAEVEITIADKLGAPLKIRTKILLNLLYRGMPGLTKDEKQALYIDFLERRPYLDPETSPAMYKEALKEDPYLNGMRVKFGYAITCHKSQGSEWPYVFVDANFTRAGKDYFRWLYTAITRASKKLFIREKALFTPPRH